MELKTQVNHKKVFSTIGLALFIGMGVTKIVSKLLYKLADIIDLSSKPWVPIAITVIDLYLIGFPIFILIVNKLPDGELRESKKLSVGGIIKVCIIGVATGTLFFIVSSIINSLITSLIGSEVTSGVGELVGENSVILTFMVVGIIGPIVEELMFRKYVINKTRQYGDKIAIFTSGILFGLFHGNLEQVFYTAAMGAFLAYVTLKTGTIKYAIIAHIFNNSLTVLTTTLISLGLSESMINNIFFAFIVVGLILFIINRKKIKLLKGEIELEKGTAFSVTCLNIGMILFFIHALVEIIQGLL